MSTMCSAGSIAASEPLAGTASVAQSWVVIEQPGPWGRQALIDSHLDPLLGESLLAASTNSGTTILLARIFLGERLAFHHLLGAVCVFIGILLAVRRDA